MPQAIEFRHEICDVPPRSGRASSQLHLVHTLPWLVTNPPKRGGFAIIVEPAKTYATFPGYVTLSLKRPALSWSRGPMHAG
jgi:hypothetical protein